MMLIQKYKQSSSNVGIVIIWILDLTWDRGKCMIKVLNIKKKIGIKKNEENQQQHEKKYYYIKIK